MSFHFNPKLVTNGLLWAVDAANNASYNGITNTWNDLTVNNQNLTLLSGSGAVKSLPVYNSNNLGNFFFNWTGSTSYMSGSYAINSGQNFSVFVWLYPTIGLAGSPGLTTSRGMVLNTSYAYQNGVKDGWCIGLQANNNATTDSQFYKFFITMGGSDSNIKTANTGSFINQWNYMGATVANSANTSANMLLYRNGINIPYTETAAGLATPILYNYPTTTLGARYTLNQPAGQPDWLPGYIAAAHVYNRVLTPQEVSQNYNAYKSRFGLT
jgi:hypothetical protein